MVHCPNSAPYLRTCPIFRFFNSDSGWSKSHGKGYAEQRTSFFQKLPATRLPYQIFATDMDVGGGKDW